MIKWYRSRILRRLIKFGTWGVAIREYDKQFLYEGNKNTHPFVKINNTKEYWFADPILLEQKNNTWLFVEAFNNKKKRGEIGVFDIIDGIAQNFRIIIDEEFHMSFPLIFEIDGRKYMIPETGDNNKITLYSDVSFPDKWKLEKDLLVGDRYRDTTVYTIGDDIYLYTYIRTDNSRFFHTYKCLLYKLDRISLKLELIEDYSDDSAFGRSAGPAFYHGDKMIHVTQKCDKCYGEGIIFWKNAASQISWKKSKPYKMILGKDLYIEGIGSPLITHTYSKTSKYEVIDYKIKK